MKPWRTAMRRPRTILSVAAILIAATLPGLARLELRTDGRALTPEHAPEVRADRDVRERFDVRDPAVIVVRGVGPDGVFVSETLRLVADLTRRAAEIEGVDPGDLSSLSVEPGLRHRAGSLKLRGLIEELPETPEEIAELRDDLRRIELYDGVLVSREGDAAAILIDVPPEADRADFAARLEALVVEATDQGVAEVQVDILGAPLAEALLGRHLLADLGLPGAPRSIARDGPPLLPLALAATALVFFLAFRRSAAALLPLVEAGTAIVVVLGMMGYVGVPLTLVTAVMPILLVAIGTADEIHIFHRYLHLDPGATESREAHDEIIERALRDTAPAILRTTATTAAAFLSFAVSPLAAVRHFGVATAFGVIVCLLFSWTVVPAVLSLSGPRPWIGMKNRRSLDRRASTLWTTWDARILRRRRMILTASLIAGVFIAFGVSRVHVDDGWISGFAPESEFARATRAFDHDFLGSHLLRLELNVPASSVRGEIDAAALTAHDLRLPKSLLNVDPQRLQESWIRLYRLDEQNPKEWTTWIEEIEENGDVATLKMPALGGSAKFWLRPAVGEKIGFEISAEPFVAPATLQRAAAFESFLAARPEVGGVLGPARYASTVGFMTRPNKEDARALPSTPREAKHRWSNYAVMRGEERLARLVDAERRRALITVFVPDASYAAVAELLASIDAWSDEYLAPHGWEITAAGDVAVSQAMIAAVVETQVRSLALSLIAILLATSLLFRSLRCGLLCLLPPLCGSLFVFAVMGATGIPLGVASSMLACMTLGVGVDFAVHRLSRPDFASVAPAILIDACAVGAGFAVLVFSSVPANARLGVFLVISIAVCLLATFVLLPVAASRDNSFEELSKKP